MELNRRLALLIDGDNAQASLLPQMLAEVSKHGTITIERVYGDWSEVNMKSWKDVASNYELDAEQKFRTSHDKNSTDIALIMDAMDLLYNAKLDGFAIASSDSDYIPLVRYLREKGMYVLGIGKRMTPSTYIRVCDDFIYTEDLQPMEPVRNDNITTSIGVAPIITENNSKVPDKDVAHLKKLLRKAFEAAEPVDDWEQVSVIGSYLHKVESEFDPRDYGHKTLSLLVQAHPKFIEVKNRKNKSGNEVLWVRLKGKSKAAK